MKKTEKVEKRFMRDWKKNSFYWRHQTMNNRYLYRAKRTDNGKWVEGDLVHSVYKIDDICVGKYGSEVGMHQVDESTICQCTGLKDKNGKLIWENDIVQYCDCTVENYVIAWEENKICFEYQQYGCSIMNFDELSGIEVKVIGNIFDNPELLEVGE